MGAALLLIAGIVFGLEDREIFVSPPDAVAEQFVRKLETGRYARAREHHMQVFKLDDSEAPAVSFPFGADPAVIALGISGVSLWLNSQANRALVAPATDANRAELDQLAPA